MNNAVISLLASGVLETLYITLIAFVCAYAIGLPLGILMTISRAGGIFPLPAVNLVLGFIINVVRSVPFIILLVAVIPVTRFITGTTIGATATIVPLTIAAAPFIARLVEGSLNEVDPGVIEAAQAMGAGNFKIVTGVLLPEAVPSLINGAAIAITTILGYSAMSGIVGGGGLGAIAINYGYYRYQTVVMVATIVVLVAVVQAFQGLGNWLTRKGDRRIR